MKADYETQLIYRKTDENGDYVIGDTGEGFVEAKDAMGQMLKTRLAACKGEWWEGDDTAIPWFSDVLGQMVSQGKKDEIDLLVVNRIMDTVGVLSVKDVTSTIEKRVYSFSCTVLTVYGEVEVEVSK